MATVVHNKLRTLLVLFTYGAFGALLCVGGLHTGTIKPVDGPGSPRYISSAGSSSAAITNPMTAQVAFYLMGIGTKLIIDRLITEHKASLAEIVGDDPLDVKTVGIVLQAALKVYLAQLVEQTQWSPYARVFSTAFDAGIKAVMLWDSIKALVDLGVVTITPLLYKGFLESMKAVGLVPNQASLYYDLTYPLKARSITALTCGQNDPYCLKQEQRPQVEIASEKERLLREAINHAVEILHQRALGFVLGAHVADAAYMSAREFVSLVNTVTYGQQPLGGLSAVMSTTLNRYLEILLGKDMQNALLALLEDIAETISRAANKVTALPPSMWAGLKTTVAYKGLWPAEQRFLENIGLLTPTKQANK